MNVQSIIHRPEVVVPDANIDSVTPQQLTDAINVRLTKHTASAGRNVGVRSITGNELVKNPLLPPGKNFTVGSCVDNVEGRIFFANCNEDGDHAIYVMNTNTATGVEEFQSVLTWGGLLFQKDDYVSMAYNRGTIIWSCPHTEPRYLDVQKGINTEIYKKTNQIVGPILPLSPSGQYTSYNFDQLKQPPMGFGQVAYSSNTDPTTGINAAVVLSEISSNGTKRPLSFVTKYGYQFAYNFVYYDFTESRLSEPSKAFFGLLPSGAPLSLNNVQHIIYLDWQDRTFVLFQNVVSKIKWYVRQGNTGEWKWFAETTPNGSNFDVKVLYANQTLGTYGVAVPRIDLLYSIGAISPSAALAVDGIAKRVVDNIFADNRIIHAGLQIGEDLIMPSATLSVRKITDQNEITNRSYYRTFLPIKRKKFFSLVFYDSKNRIIGTKRVGSVNAPFNPGVFIGLYGLDMAGSSLSEKWKALGTNTIVNDLDDGKFAIDVTIPTLTTEITESFQKSDVQKIGLSVRDEFDIPNFLRGQLRAYWVFEDQNGKLIYGYPSINGKNCDDWSGSLKFYGIGFQIPEGLPINFSNEQNLYISVRGITDTADPNYVRSKEQNYFFEQDFKVTGIDKTVLLCKSSWTQNGYDINNLRLPTVDARFVAGTYNTNEDDNFLTNLYEMVVGSDDKTVFTGWKFDFITYKRFAQTIVDAVIYSKNEISDNQYNVIPDIFWTAENLYDQNTNRTVSYYGDSYKINNFQQVQSPTVIDLYFYFESQSSVIKTGVQKVPNFAYGDKTSGGGDLSPVDGFFIVASATMAGNTDVDYTQDIGNVAAENQFPKKENLLRIYAHGEQFIEGTKLNNWFLFNPTNRRTVSGNVGNIVRVMNQSLTTNQGENIYLYCTQGVEMVYLGKVQQVGTDGTGVLSLSTNIFGTTNVMRLPYGPKNPKQVTQTTAGMTYYFDSANKVLVQVSASGQDSISEQRKFQTDTRKIYDTSVIGFDPFNMEVVLIDDSSGLAYNIVEEKYQGRRRFIKNDLLTFVASEVQPRTMYGFYNGEAYRFLNDPPPSGIVTVNGFPIQQFIKFVANHEINKHKVFSFIKLMAEYNNGVDTIDWSAIIEGYNQGQLGVSPSDTTSIMAADFTKRNYYYQATIKTSDQIDPFDGPLITGPFIEITLLGDEKYKNLIFAEIGFTLPPAQ